MTLKIQTLPICIAVCLLLSGCSTLSQTAQNVSVKRVSNVTGTFTEAPQTGGVPSRMTVAELTPPPTSDFSHYYSDVTTLPSTVSVYTSDESLAQVGFNQPSANNESDGHCINAVDCGCRSCRNNARGADSGYGCPSGYGACQSCNNVPHGYAVQWAPQQHRYDPQEFLCDGGDQPPDATLTNGRRISGLQVEDTVSHYTTEAGNIEFTASNRVCVYAPRFGNVRRITGAIQGDRAIAVSGVIRPVGPQNINLDLPGLVIRESIEVDHEEFTHRIDSMRDRNRGVRIENIQQLELAADVLDVLANIQNVSLSLVDETQWLLLQRYAVAANAWTIQETVEVEIQDLAPPVLTRDQKVDALVVYEFPDAGRLNLIKLADKQHAGIGEQVTFALRLQNVGDSAVSGIVVTDNLTTRLDYIADSQTSSMDADFETVINSAGSSQLTWRLKGELAVGESVTIEFKTRVR